MAIQFLEAGTNATYGTEFWTSTSGTVTSSTSFTREGRPRSLKCDGGAGPSSALVTKSAIMADAGRRISFWMYIETLPSGGADIVELYQSNLSTFCTYFGVNSSAKFSGFDGTNGTIVLTTGRWYHVALAYTITSTTVNQFRLWVDGVLDISVSNGTITAVSTSQLRLGLLAPSGANCKIYFDSIYVDDNSGLTFPGFIGVSAQLPGSVVTNGFLGTNLGTGAINERALSQTNAKVSTATGTQDQTYDIQASWEGDTDLQWATCVGSMSWLWGKCSTSTDNANIWDRNAKNAITLTTTPALYTHITDSANYPTAGQSNVGLDATSKIDTLYECGMLVAYKQGIASYLLGHPFGVSGGRQMNQLLAQ